MLQIGELLPPWRIPEVSTVVIGVWLPKIALEEFGVRSGLLSLDARRGRLTLSERECSQALLVEMTERRYGCWV